MNINFNRLQHTSGVRVIDGKLLQSTVLDKDLCLVSYLKVFCVYTSKP